MDAMDELAWAGAKDLAQMDGQSLLQQLPGAGYDPRDLIRSCKKVSSACEKELVKPLAPKLVAAYANYTAANVMCERKFVREQCWDKRFNKWKQGECEIDDACSSGLDQLETVCSEVGGVLCQGSYRFGFAGSVVQFMLPTCAPEVCHDNGDMQSISKCVDNATCGQLPAEVISACSIDFGCFDKDHAALYVAFAFILGGVLAFFGLFYLAWSGLLSCKRCCRSGAGSSRKVVNQDRSLGGAQAGLLDGLGVNVPLTVESQATTSTPDLMSPLLDDGKEYIVQGEQSILNTQSITRATSGLPDADEFQLDSGAFASASGRANTFDSDASGADASADDGEDGLAPPKFKLSKRFERHVIKGFMFRRQELRGKGESGWGTGSTGASSLVWRSLFYRSKGNLILKGVSGYIRPGMCVACIGAPDSGATTLLKVLAGRNSGGRVTGEVLLDGYPPSAKIKKILAYIPKEDLNLPTLTVRETLEFSLNLRSPTELPAKLRAERIDVILSLLGLSHVADTIVGDQLIRGISGGEKRRVSLGVELVVGRSLLLASQPTNGLDSSAAYDVIKATRALSDTGLAAFMATVSQPSPELLALFDTVAMISRGTCIYFGPTAEAERFFFRHGFVRPPTKAISDFLEEMTGDAEQFHRESAENNDAAGEESAGASGATMGEQDASNGAGGSTTGLLIRKESIARQSLVSAFRKSDLYQQLGLAMWHELDHAALLREKQEAQEEMDEMRAGLDEQDGQSATANGPKAFLTRQSPRWLLDDDGQLLFCGPSAYTTGFFYQCFTVLVRQIQLTLRSPTLRVRVGRAVFQGVLIGSMFFQVENDQQGATSRFGLLFLSISSVVFGSMSVIPELFAQRQVYYAQRSAGYFRPLVYIVSLLSVEIPIVVIETLIYSVMVYSMCGLRNGLVSWNYLYFWATILAQQVTAWTLCFLVVMASPSAVVAQAVCPTFIAIFSLFCGYLVPRNQLFKPMRWLWDASPLSRSVKGLAINEVVGLAYHCTDEQLYPPLTNPLLNVTAPNGYNSAAYRTCPLASGAASLYMYDYNSGEQDKWVLFLQNLIFPATFTALLLVVMYTVHYEADSSDSAGQLIESRRREMLKEKERILEARKAGRAFRQEMEIHGSAGELGGAGDGALAGQSGSSVVPKVSGCIEFHNLNYSVEIPRGRWENPQRLQLLFDVCGYAEPGRIVALMGPSGAGKSTLLDVLADKKTGGIIEAETLLINGNPRGPDYPRFAGYVEQMDSHLPTLKVREAIEASALLRLPHQVSAAERSRMVEQVIGQLGLGPFENNLIGTPPNMAGIPGVSPEIRKKTTIAVELAMDPALLYLDEPTTGLDTASALAVMQAVRSACADKATMCTIHQPSAEVFQLFDWILLLQTGGRVCYFGPVDAMSAYFTKHGFGECPLTTNPADFALQCTRKQIDGASAADVFDESEERRAVLEDAPRLRHARGEVIPGYGIPSPYKSPYATSFGTQFGQLLVAQYHFLLRDTALLKMRCSTAIFFGLIIGLLFFDSKLDVAGAQARVALCFISCTYVGYSAILCIPQMIDQRPVQFRETTSNMYTLLPYFLALTVAEIPFILLQNFCYIATFYFMVGLRTEPDKILLFCTGMFMLNLACFAFSSFVATISPNADAGTIINTVVNSVFTLFCGFLLPFKSIPIYWKPMYYASMFRYPLAFLISNELHGRQFSCPNNERAIPIFVGGLDPNAPPFPFGGSTMLNPRCAFDAIVHNTSAVLNDPHCFRYFCPVEDGDALLRQYNFPTTQSGLWASLSTMVGFYLVWRGLALLGLKYIQHIRR